MESTPLIVFTIFLKMVYSNRKNLLPYFLLEKTSFQKGNSAKELKQDVTKVVSFEKKMKEHSVPFK